MVNIKIKKIFFWILVLIFLAITPCIVYYAMGYRFSFERGIFIYSGSVTLKPTPREIEVFIDNKQVSTGVVNFLNYSYHIGSVLPGKYMLEVRSHGYLPWSKEVHVHSGVSTEFWNIFLPRENYTKIQYPIDNTENFFISPDGKKIAVVENNNEGVRVNVLDVKKEEVLYSFSFPEYKFSKNKKENIEWSPKEGRLIVPLEKNEGEEYFIINIGTEESYSLNNKLNLQNIRKLRWSSDDRNTLFYVFEDKLFRVDLDASENILEVADKIAGYDLSGSNIYYLSKENGIIYRKNISGRGDSEQITTEVIRAQMGNDLELIVYDKDRIVVIAQDKKLYLYNHGEIETKISELATGVLGVHFSNDGKKLAFWNNNEISVYFVRKWETQPSREEGQKIDIVRFSQPIENVSWFRDYEHLIFTAGNQVKIVELDNRSLKNISDLVSINSNKIKATYNLREDNLFFIDKASEIDKLYSISLTEETEE
ncbi:MAG TPA: hypothetical protein DDY52_03660 [Candidatus Moranbacteria bacterium]|nr:hypothetical protein [Candidatus Moranbacteria bacterium]